MIADALLVFCLLALAALSAIGLFALTGWRIERDRPRVDIENTRGMPLNDAHFAPSFEPYSPPLMTPLFAPVAFDDSTHTTMTAPTFQGFVCDSHDEKYHFQPFRCESGSTGGRG
jgi:hypothetical protein